MSPTRPTTERQPPPRGDRRADSDRRHAAKAARAAAQMRDEAAAWDAENGGR